MTPTGASNPQSHEYAKGHEDFALVDLVEQGRCDVGPARYTLGVLIDS